MMHIAKLDVCVVCELGCRLMCGFSKTQSATFNIPCNRRNYVLAVFWFENYQLLSLLSK